MAYEFFVGRRYLRIGGSRPILSAITILSTVGVAVGVMVMVVVIAVMSGAESELRRKLLGITAHVVVMPHGERFTEYREALSRIRRVPGVTAASPYIYTQAMFRSASGIRGAVLRGVDPGTAGRVTPGLDPAALRTLQAWSGEGDAARAAPGIVLGKELARLLGVQAGDPVFLTISQGASTSLSRLPAMKRFQVLGVFASGLHEFDKAMAYISLSQAQKLLEMPGAVTGIEVRVREIYQADQVAEKIVAMMGYPFWTQDWMRMNRNIFSALRLQKTVLFIILTMIVIVAAFNIASTLIMMVMSKTRDIAILKAMGATNRSVRRIFVYKGMTIGTIGTGLGAVGGVILCGVIRRYPIIHLPSDVYFFSTLPVSLQTLDVAVIVLTTLLICLFATLYPAFKAARLDPVEGLRYE